MWSYGRERAWGLTHMRLEEQRGPCEATTRRETWGWKPPGLLTLTAHTLFRGNLLGPISCPASLFEVSWPDPFSTGPCYHAHGILSPSGHRSRCPLSLWSLDPDLPMPGLVQLSSLQRPSLASKPQTSWASSLTLLFLSGSCHYWKLFLCLPPLPH